MTETEGFLSRWTRRKQAAATSLEAEIDAAIAASATRAPGAAEAPAAGAAAPVPGSDTDTQPIVDLSALPAIDSVTAATDIRPFLAPGVPAELTRAALRRAWATDPQVRDFIGIAENQWDFTDPNGVPGFGPIGPLDDVRRMVVDLLGEDRSEGRNMSETAAAVIDAHPLDTTASSGASSDAAPAAEVAATEGMTAKAAAEPPRMPPVASAEDHVAAQDDEAAAAAEPLPVRRGHGGALPR